MRNATQNNTAKNLVHAIAAFTSMSGMNLATIAALAMKIIGMLASRWEHICAVAHSEEADGKVVVSFRLSLDFTRKCPCGGIGMGFSQRVKDETTFVVEDPDQINMPFAQAVGREEPSTPAQRNRQRRRVGRLAEASSESPKG